MKKIILGGVPQISFFLFVSIFAFGQSVTILPSQTTNQSNTGGENINVTANSNSMGIYGRRFNGTFASKSPVLNGNELFRVSAGGFWNSASESQNAAIKFNATENWGAGSGSKISFTTTANGNVSQTERMVINHDGKVGIGNLSPVGKLHINHLSTATDAHLHLQSTGASSSIIRATSTAIGSEWNNHFINNASAASNLVYWTNSVNSSTPLILTGEGDAVVERNTTIGGFTKLGSDAAAPKIKIIKLTTTNGAAGISTPIAHGLSQPKILSVSVLINANTGNDIPPRSTYSGFEYDFFVSPTNIFIKNISGNDANIVGRPVRILITYEE